MVGAADVDQRRGWLPSARLRTNGLRQTTSTGPARVVPVVVRFYTEAGTRYVRAELPVLCCGLAISSIMEFPSMSIRENVLAGLRLTGQRASRGDRDDLVETCLARARQPTALGC